MADTFHIMGDDVYFRGYRVATLATDTPATVRDEAEAALDAYHPDAIDPDEHKANLADLESAQGEAYDASVRIGELERELEDERDTSAALRAQIEALEADLDALEKAKP